jgi:hypothetical protein
MTIENKMNGISESTESRNFERYVGIEPEMDLLVAYLEDARGKIERARKNNSSNIIASVVGVYNWINGYNKSALSFESVCEALDFDSDTENKLQFLNGSNINRLFSVSPT